MYIKSLALSQAHNRYLMYGKNDGGGVMVVVVVLVLIVLKKIHSVLPLYLTQWPVLNGCVIFVEVSGLGLCFPDR